MKKFYLHFAFSTESGEKFWFFICDKLFFLLGHNSGHFHQVYVNFKQNEFIFSPHKTFKTCKVYCNIYPIYKISFENETELQIGDIIPIITTENENKFYSIIDKYF